MAQSSGPISQGTASERQFTDVLWRDRFGDEPGVLGDMDGTSYALTLPSSSDIVSVGSATQASVATVAGFAHRIPAGSPEPLTIPVAVGATRTDIIGLRYDPSYTGLPGPVRLYRTPGTNASIPTYDASPPGVEDLPLWSITRVPGQALNQATVQRLFPRIAPSMEIAVGADLPVNSPLGTAVRQGTLTWRRQLNPTTPAWVKDPAQILVGGIGSDAVPVKAWIGKVFAVFNNISYSVVQCDYSSAGFTSLPIPQATPGAGNSFGTMVTVDNVTLTGCTVTLRHDANIYANIEIYVTVLGK